MTRPADPAPADVPRPAAEVSTGFEVLVDKGGAFLLRSDGFTPVGDAQW